MMRSRSRSRARHSSNYARSRSRSPNVNRSRPFRGSYHQHGRPDNRRDREDYNRQTKSFSRSSPDSYRNRQRSRSHSPNLQAHNSRKEEIRNDYHRSHRSPVHPESNYHCNPTSQRLTTEPIPKERSIFIGPEGTLIDLNELKKITVDIRRNLSGSHGPVPFSHGPLRYAFDPADVILIRRPGEGSRPIFDREELKPRPAEERVIKLAPDLADRNEDQGSRNRESFSASVPQFHQDVRPVEGDGEGDLRFRLIEKKSSEENKERLNTDLNYAPQGRYYNEHDNRERFQNNRGRIFRGNGRGNYHSNFNPGSGGGFRGNYRGGNSNYREQFRGSYRGKLRSPDWKHDLYDTAPADDGKPSSTTQI